MGKSILSMTFEEFQDSPEQKYARHVREHIANVKRAYDFIKSDIPKLMAPLEIPQDEMDAQIICHDRSKYSEEEFIPSAEFFYGLQDDAVKAAYDKAWEHHWRNNPHHPEYWEGQDMPYSCLLEMLCDLWSFGWAKDDKDEIFSYWEANKAEKQKAMSAKSFSDFEGMLAILRDHLDRDDDIQEAFFLRDPSDRAYKDGKKEAVDAVIASRSRHLAANDSKREDDPKAKDKLRRVTDNLSKQKDEHLVNLVKDADKTDDRISIDIRDDDRMFMNTKSVTADFEGKTHMSLHTIKGRNPILDHNREGRSQSTGYGENDRFIKDMTGQDIKKLAKDKYDDERKAVGLREDGQDKLSAMKSLTAETMSYRYDNMSRNMKTAEETDRKKLGMCHDTALALYEKLRRAGFDENGCGILTCGGNLDVMDKGWTHSFAYATIDGRYYWLECSWYSLRGIHGPYESMKAMKNDFEDNIRKYDKDPKDGIMWFQYKKPYENEPINDWCRRVFPKGLFKGDDKQEKMNEENIVTEDILYDDGAASEAAKLKDVVDQIALIDYGFISTKDGSRIDDREFIHNCRNLGDIYAVQTDPEKTINQRLGICTDQSLATEYLLNKLHPEIKVCLYALLKGRFGHCVCTFEDDGRYYYLEHAWDKYAGLHGPFDSKEELEAYLDHVYHEAHDKDNNDRVIVKPYLQFKQEQDNLNEAFVWGYRMVLKEGK